MSAPAIRGVLFDLDNTLVHRDLSIARYAQRLASDYADRPRPTPPDTIAALMIERDGRGYGVPGSTFPTVRDDVTATLLARLPWHAAGLRAVSLRGFHAWPDGAARLPTIASLSELHQHLGC